MTDEGKSLTDRWVEEHEAHYPYAFDKGGAIKRFFGVSGIPHAVLIDSTGTVVWKGHPATLNSGEIEKHLAGALRKPLHDWPKEAKKVAQALAKGMFAKALAEAEKLEDSTWREQVEGLVEGRVKVIESLKATGDWLAVEEQGEIYARELRGLPAAATIEAELDALKDDPQAQTVLDAQKRIRKLTEGKIKRRQIPKIRDELNELAREHPDTIVQRDADRAIALITKGA